MASQESSVSTFWKNISNSRFRKTDLGKLLVKISEKMVLRFSHVHDRKMTRIGETPFKQC